MTKILHDITKNLTLIFELLESQILATVNLALIKALRNNEGIKQRNRTMKFQEKIPTGAYV